MCFNYSKEKCIIMVLEFGIIIMIVSFVPKLSEGITKFNFLVQKTNYSQIFKVFKTVFQYNLPAIHSLLFHQRILVSRFVVEKLIEQYK